MFRKLAGGLKKEIGELFNPVMVLGRSYWDNIAEHSNMLTSKQHLIMKAFELPEELLDTAFAEELSAKEISTVEDFKTALLELGAYR